LRGVSVLDLVNQCYGNAQDRAKGRQMPVHYSFKSHNYVSISSPLGTQIIQAAGCAYAMKTKGTKQVVLTSFGDGSSSEIDFHSGMNFAAVTKSPCVFLLENNQYAISVPVARQSASETFAIKADAYGMPGARVDGNDVLAVYQATKEAVERARKGEGPTLIEAVTFRMGAHSTSDDPSRYVPKEQFEEWKKKDPIERFEKFLLRQNILKAADIKRIATAAEEEVAAAIKQAEKADPHPPIDSMFDDVYEQMPELLRIQRDAMRKDHEEHGIPGGH
jgi:pyruvate dehydrogenase E1 component alpha subunit